MKTRHKENGRMSKQKPFHLQRPFGRKKHCNYKGAKIRVAGREQRLEI
jgi:hypothetical protein